MYCVKCGVRLQDGIPRCPLCGTPVWDPEVRSREDRYPDTLPEHHSESNQVLAITMTAVCLIAAAVVLAVCFRLYGSLRWGGYAIGGILLFYMIAVLPCWFRDPKGEIFVPVDHAAAGGYALFICLRTGGHWFLSFAFPILGMSCILITGMICLLKHVRRGKVFVFGGFMILSGGATMLVEFFEHITFGTDMFRWSLFALAGFGAVGIFLLTVGMIPPLRQALERRFFF